ncbi:four-carbon acid sugar kinase family protein [Bradyrhizobium sp. CCGE-LA001]|uniref:four-carbon acid sugar kinase family protein n=1 Tax=Bradyrhizobium sp. CCGE-LA001 TaxID=1223566 RepID=UPI000745E849|nr:four-carbon acid sugar kinase family protein [Bradyrhizobium sp. CCGE-LA001]AMA56854.1 type III effector [Bradyrhizobium sp. CCGE-LA001]
MSLHRPLPAGPLVAFYGDDFTGSSAAMQVLAFAGLETILFLKPPSKELLRHVAGSYRGIGIAGVARARSPEWMDDNLPAIFDLMDEAGAPILHYKLCSTFDSAPHIGNVGRAAEIGLRKYPGWAPMLVSDPGMGRFQAFGNLFAHANGVGYRLDRHPTMSVHPVTPMQEADLARHLADLSRLRVGLVDFATMKKGAADALLQHELQRGVDIVSLDVLDQETLEEAGRLIWEGAGERQFVLGSQGVEQALVAHWRAAGLIPATLAVAPPEKVDQIAVVSGSVSPITAAQIQHAEAQGFELIPLAAEKAVSEDALKVETDRTIAIALQSIRNGHSPLVFTAAGPDDERVSVYRATIETSDIPVSVVNDRIGSALGNVLNALIRQTGLHRVVISGGDTSGQAASRLGIDALSAVAPLSPGVPLCRAHSPDAAIDGLEIALKGGQTGAPDFFTAVRGKQ